MNKFEEDRNICFLSASLRHNDEEQYFALEKELEEDFVCISGPTLVPSHLEKIVSEDNFRTAHKLNHIYRRKLWIPLSSVDFIISKAFDDQGVSVIEAEAASQVNSARPKERSKILGIFMDENQNMELTRQYQYPLGSDHQISIEAAYSMSEIAPLLSKIVVES